MGSPLPSASVQAIETLPTPAAVRVTIGSPGSVAGTNDVAQTPRWLPLVTGAAAEWTNCLASLGAATERWLESHGPSSDAPL
jgi:hypothetical protein